MPARASGQLAVVPLVGTDAKTNKLARSLTRKLAATLKRTGAGRDARVFPRSKAGKLLRCVQQRGCLERLGQSLNLKYFIAGQIARLDNRFHIDVWLLSVERGGIMRSGTARARRVRTVERRLMRLGRRIVEGLSSQTRTATRRTQRAERKPMPTEAHSNATRDTEDPDEIDSPDWIDNEPEQTSTTQPLWKRLSFWAWTTGGVTAVALVTAVGFGIANLGNRSDAEDAEYQGEAAIAYDAAGKNATAANVFFGISSALAIGSGLLFYLAYFSSDSSSERSAGGPALQFSATPLRRGSQTDGGALLLEGRF
jgi:TolB-like protein